MVNKTFQNYIKDYLNIKKECDGECTGENADKCEKCMIINAHKFLYGSLKERLSLSDEVDSSGADITPFLTGSYRRHTIIRPPKDVDGFIALNADDYQDNTPREIIELLYSELIEVYSEFDDKPEINIQSHSVCVQFSDNFGADVIPAFSDGDLYKIPELNGDSDDGDWLISNPKKHVDYVSEVNQANDGLVIHIVRLLKSWKRDKFESLAIDMKSFHLEMLAVHIFDDNPIESISEGLLTFFRNAQGYLDGILEDPALKDAGVDSDLNGMLDEEEKVKLKELITKELEVAEKAFELEGDGEDIDAFDYWKKVFTSDDFAESVNDTVGKQVAEKLTLGTPVYRNKSSQEYSFERNDDSRSVPRSKSWHK